MRKRQYVLVGVVVLLVVGLAGGYFMGRRMVIQRADPEKGAVTAQEALTHRPGDTIIKGQTQDSTNYKLYGSFTSKLQSEGKYFTGLFVVTGDKFERRIPIFVGAADGSVLWGEYEGSLRGNSKWELVSTANLAEWIKPGEEVTLELTLPAVEGTESTFLDRLKQEIVVGLGVEPIAVPENMGLATGKVGRLP